MAACTGVQHGYGPPVAAAAAAAAGGMRRGPGAQAPPPPQPPQQRRLTTREAVALDPSVPHVNPTFARVRIIKAKLEGLQRDVEQRRQWLEQTMSLLRDCAEATRTLAARVASGVDVPVELLPAAAAAAAPPEQHPPTSEDDPTSCEGGYDEAGHRHSTHAPPPPSSGVGPQQQPSSHGAVPPHTDRDPSSAVPHRGVGRHHYQATTDAAAVHHGGVTAYGAEDSYSYDARGQQWNDAEDTAGAPPPSSCPADLTAALCAAAPGCHGLSPDHLAIAVRNLAPAQLRRLSPDFFRSLLPLLLQWLPHAHHGAHAFALLHEGFCVHPQLAPTLQGQQVVAALRGVLTSSSANASLPIGLDARGVTELYYALQRSASYAPF